jgi:hypothetical protein
MHANREFILDIEISFQSHKNSCLNVQIAAILRDNAPGPQIRRQRTIQEQTGQNKRGTTI